MTDLRDKRIELKSLLNEKAKHLTEREKELMRIAMEFGYTSAFCSRTCDMNESFFHASEYEHEYKEILETLK